MKKLLLNIDGKDVSVLAQKISGVLWFHYQGETYQYSPESSATGSSVGGVNQDATRIVAPMPGKVIKIHKAQGSSVLKGETLVVMEAMKMEYNLKAIQDMKIVNIYCEEQQVVSLGDLLVELEEE